LSSLSPLLSREPKPPAWPDQRRWFASLWGWYLLLLCSLGQPSGRPGLTKNFRAPAGQLATPPCFRGNSAAHGWEAPKKSPGVGVFSVRAPVLAVPLSRQKHKDAMHRRPNSKGVRRWWCASPPDCNHRFLRPSTSTYYTGVNTYE